MDSECFEDTCPSTLGILDLPCPACVHDHVHLSSLFSQACCLAFLKLLFQLLMTLFPEKTWSPWKRTSAPSRRWVSTLQDLPPSLPAWATTSPGSRPQVESHWPHLSLWIASLCACGFFQHYSYQYGNILLKHISRASFFSYIFMTCSVTSFHKWHFPRVAI